MSTTPLPPAPPLDDASVAGEEDPGAAVDDGIGGPPVPDVPVGPPPGSDAPPDRGTSKPREPSPPA